MPQAIEHAISATQVASLNPQRVSEWHAQDALVDGVRIHLRMMEPDDFERERDFVEGLSPRTGYQRLMSARKPTLEELRRWTRVDRAREGAVVMTAFIDGRERQLGVARYVLDGPPGDADFAMVIADEWQGKGLGARLLNALVDLARQSGVRRLVGTTLSENRKMLMLARRLGFRPGRQPGAAIVTSLTLSLQDGLEVAH